MIFCFACSISNTEYDEMNLMMIIKVIVEDDDKGLKMIQKESFLPKKETKTSKIICEGR